MVSEAKVQAPRQWSLGPVLSPFRALFGRILHALYPQCEIDCSTAFRPAPAPRLSFRISPFRKMSRSANSQAAKPV